MEWIKCSERLPEVNKPCWIYIPTGHKTIREGTMYEFSDGKKWCASGVGLLKQETTHWQPLIYPEPPQGE